MNETIIFFVALALVLIGGQMGMKAGAFPALSRMLATVVAFFIAMRYWFPLSQLASGLESTPFWVVILLVFWPVFLLTFSIFTNWCDKHFDTLESTRPSVLGRIVGMIFGCVSGAVIVAVLLMTLSLVAPQLWPSYKRAALPLHADTAPERLYRMVESHVGQVKANDPARTLLPDLAHAGSSEPVEFWR